MVKKIVNNDMSEVLASKCALVDFSAAWCGPCNMIGPVVERLSEERDDVEFFNVDVDKNPDLAMKYRIQSIPALVLFKDGEEYRLYNQVQDIRTYFVMFYCKPVMLI